MRTRSNLAAVPEYQAGRLGTAREAIQQGIALLSSNELPWGPPTDIADAIRATVDWTNRYPSMSNDELREALSARHGVGPDHVVVGCGGVEIGRLAAAAVLDPGREVLFGDHSFQEYSILAHINSATPVPVPMQTETYDLGALTARVRPETALVIVCNPNNPTGTGVSTTQVEAMLDALPPTFLTLVDEAYWEFTAGRLGESAVSLTERHSNLVVLRTFSKAFGLAGLRVGYGICGSPQVASAMRKLQLPFSVNMLAQVAAMSALQREPEVLETARRIAAARDRVRQELLELGFDVPESHANFVYVRGAAGVRLGTVCGEAGVTVRPDAQAGIRITIGTDAENERMLTAARQATKRPVPAGSAG